MHNLHASSFTHAGDCLRRLCGRIYKLERTRTNAVAAGVVPFRNTVASLFGTVCHSVVADCIDKNHEDKHLPALIDAEFDNEMQKVHRVVWDKITLDIAAARTQAWACCFEMLRLWRELDQTAVHLEHEMSASAMELTGETNHADFHIRGTADIITPSLIIDWKTGTRLLQHPPQLTVYAWLAEQEWLPIKQTKHIWVNRKTAESRVFTYDYNEAAVAQMRLIALSVLDTGVFAPAFNPQEEEPPEGYYEAVKKHLHATLPNPNSNLCGEKYCVLFNSPFCRDGAAAKGISPTPQQGGTNA